MSTNKAAYLMARLTTKGLQPGIIFGGIPDLTKSDIAAACSKLPSLDFHLIMAKYCDDVNSALDAMGEVQDLMCSNSSVFADMDPFKRTSVAASIIQEFVSSRKCPRCKGTGQKLVESKIAACKPCGGSGQKSVSLNARATACDIPEATFRRQGLNQSYESVMQNILDIELRAMAKIARKAS